MRATLRPHTVASSLRATRVQTFAFVEDAWAGNATRAPRPSRSAHVASAATPRAVDQALAAGSASFVIAASLALIFCSSTLFSTNSNTTFEPPSPMR